MNPAIDATDVTDAIDVTDTTGGNAYMKEFAHVKKVLHIIDKLDQVSKAIQAFEGATKLCIFNVDPKGKKIGVCKPAVEYLAKIFQVECTEEPLDLPPETHSYFTHRRICKIRDYTFTEYFKAEEVVR